MIGGFNKLLRNIASIKGKSEFEKVSPSLPSFKLNYL